MTKRTSRATASPCHLTATNADGVPVTYSASGLPDGLSINTTTGLISGVVAADAGGDHSVTVTASDGTLSDSQSCTWDVSHVFITSMADQSNLDGDAVSVPVSASRPNGPVAQLRRDRPARRPEHQPRPPALSPGPSAQPIPRPAPTP